MSIATAILSNARKPVGGDHLREASQFFFKKQKQKPSKLHSAIKVRLVVTISLVLFMWFNVWY